MVMSTKSRQLSSIERVKVDYLWELPDGTSEIRNYSSVDRTLVSLKESLTDEIGTDGAFRPCVHKKLYVSRAGDLHQPYRYERFGDPFIYEETGALHRALVDETGPLVDAAFNQTPTLVGFDWDGLTASSVSSMLPSLNTGNSLINFLVELRDFKKSGQQMMRAYRRFTFAETFRDLIRAGGEAFWALFGSEPWNNRKRWKRLTNAYLMWKLAWQPFVNDIKSFITDLVDFRRTIVLYERRSHWRQQRYWGRDVPLVFGSQSWQNPFWSDWSQVSPACSTQYKRGFGPYEGKVGRFTAVMRFRYSLDRNALNAMGTVLGALDILGISANPAIIWEAIPFSFIVDWYFNIGASLETLRVDNLGSITHITDLCVSLKYKKEYVSKVAVDLNSNPGGFMPNSRRESELRGLLQYYERKVIDPTSVSTSGYAGGLTASRGAVAASILANSSQGARMRSSRPYYLMMRGKS